MAEDITFFKILENLLETVHNKLTLSSNTELVVGTITNILAVRKNRERLGKNHYMIWLEYLYKGQRCHEFFFQPIEAIRELKKRTDSNPIGKLAIIIAEIKAPNRWIIKGIMPIMPNA
jgi:hypothetical protein